MAVDEAPEEDAAEPAAPKDDAPPASRDVADPARSSRCEAAEDAVSCCAVASWRTWTLTPGLPNLSRPPVR